MTDEDEKMELKPCPFCGTNKIWGMETENPRYFICSKCTSGIPKEKWNSAYCWKLLDEKDAVIKRLKEAAESEYQEKESIKYNKRWFQEEIVKRDLEINRLRDILKTYREPPTTESISGTVKII